MKRKKMMSGILAALLSVSLLTGAAGPGLAAAATADISLQNLRTEDLTDPLGIDTATPRMTWGLLSDQRNQKQTAYQVIVSTTAEKAAEGDGDVWDSGKVASADNYAVYDGPALSSKTRYYWSVRVWDEAGAPSAYAAPAWFETAMLDESDWSAQWITVEDETAALYPYATVDISAVEARYIKLDCTKLGLALPGDGYRLQLAEIMVFDADTGENVALSGTVTSSATYSNGWWEPAFLVDGEISSASGEQGYTSDGFGSPDTNVWVEIDLGETRRVDGLRIYGRNDYRLEGTDEIPNFPRSYTIQTAGEDKAYTVRHTATDQPIPTFGEFDSSMPSLAKSFTLKDKPIQSARAYVSGLGLFEMTVNGQKATDALFEPGETNYDKRAYYVTYDITDKLTQGENAVGVTLGKGFYYNLATPDRYNRSPKTWGPLLLLCQIEVTYDGGERQVIGTDTSWKYAKGPITECSWLGGEDYDARRELTGFDQPGYDYSGWKNALPAEHLPFAVLSARTSPPLRVVEERPAVAVTNPAPGRYVVDFGLNFAGIYTYTGSQPAGTRVEFYPSELLDETGNINPASTGSSEDTPIYDSYTFKGVGEESYTPTFVYHGFRYLEIRGLEEAPTADQFTGWIVRADNAQVGSFETSDPQINQIHQMITRSISDNMYSMLTDCPHREKLGWMEVHQLLFNSVAANFDIAAWSGHVSQNVRDAQKDYGSFPSVVPPLTAGHGAHMLRPGPDDTPNDPTWSGAGILFPWYAYKTYGNLEELKIGYDSMNRYMDYLATLVEKNKPYILESEDVNRDLGDWYNMENTSVTFVITCTYYQLCDTMRQIAELLGERGGAAAYAGLAEQVKTAVNREFYHADTHSYDTGSQTANGLPLYFGMVPEDQREGVLESLVESVKARDYHLSSGEVGLRPVLNVLSDNGYADVAYRMVTNDTMPSYTYLASLGKTSLSESWEGRDSQNHCMLGHGEGWLYEYLGGIRNVGVAYDESVIAPLIPDDLTYSRVSTSTPYGKISCEWEREGNALTARVEVPVNTVSTVILPATALDTVKESGVDVSEADGVLDVSFADEQVVIRVGSGRYTFTTDRPETLYPERLQGLIETGRAIRPENTARHYTALQTALTDAEQTLATAHRQTELDQAADRLEAVLESMAFKGNLALNKPAEASSSMESADWSVDKLTDGERHHGELGHGGGYTSSADEYNPHGESVTVDLLAPSRVTRVDFYPRYLDGTIYTFAADFVIETSLDGETWETAVQETDYPPLESPDVLSFAVGEEGVGVEARYIRLRAEKLYSNPDDGNRYRLQLAEIEVYDDIPQTLEEAVANLKANLEDLTVDNNLTAEAVMEQAGYAIQEEEITAAWAEEFRLIPATEEAAGSVTGCIRLTLGDQTQDLPIDWVIEKLPSQAETVVEAARAAAEQTLAALQVTNDTQADDLLQAVIRGVDNPAVTVTWAEEFEKIPADSEQEGSITGRLRLSYDGAEAEVEVDLTIPVLQGQIVPGDLDKDGEVTIADVMEACKVMARESAGTDPTDEEIARGDLDDDGEITIADVMEICKILARGA